MPGTLFVVATPIGNLDDVTARALRVLREVDVIAAEDTRRTSHLLTRYAITTPTTSLHEHNEQKKTATLLARLGAGGSIALVSDAGTPTVSDPGQRLIQAAVAAGVRVEPIPGPSAILATLAASGFPADSFLFLGFPPTRSKDRKKWFERVKAIRGTIVFFEAPHRIHDTLHEFEREFGDCEVAVGRELTKVHEELVRGPIKWVLGRLKEERGEFTVVVNIGQITEITAARGESLDLIVGEFGEITKITGMTRRKAINVVARKHGLTPNRVYEILEDHKKSG